MRNADFTTNTGLGMTQGTLEFLQLQNKELRMILEQFLQLPSSGNIIVTGLEEGAPGEYSKGWVCIDGELLEVPEGTGSKISIVEDVEAVDYDDATTKDTYYHRYGNINAVSGTDISAFTRHGAFKTSTTILEGILRIATSGEVSAGALNNVALTPNNLQYGLKKVNSAFHSTLHTDLKGTTTSDTKAWYWKDQLGRIQFVGDKLECTNASGTTAGLVAFNLNASCRPATNPTFTFDNLEFAVPVSNTSVLYVPPKIVRVMISRNGDVKILDELDLGDIIDLRGISFITNN